MLVPLTSLVLSVVAGLYGISDVVTSPEMLSLALSYKASISVGFVGTVLFWIVLPAGALVLLLMRSRRFPLGFVVSNVALALFNLLDPFIVAIDYGFSANSLLYAAIPAVWFLGWSWYMLKSVRVKITFVN